MRKMRKTHIWNEKGWEDIRYYYRGSEKIIVQDLWLLSLKNYKKFKL